MKFRCIDAHAAGEPLRLVLDGVPKIPGGTIPEKRRWAKENIDPIRKALILEPRGHADMYGAILTEPVTEDGDYGVLFLHNEGYSTMCGHGIIALTTILIEEGMFPGETIRFDTPIGRVTASAVVVGSRVTQVSFENVVSYAYATGLEVFVPHVGTVLYDIAFGGAFYAIVDAEPLRMSLVPEEYRRIIEAATAIKSTISEQQDIRHPDGEDLGLLYGVIFVGPAHDPSHHSRNVCVFANGEVDRSPTGTGVSARAALHYVRGELALSEEIVIESIVGSTFRVRATREEFAEEMPGIVPEVTGSAYIVGKSEFNVADDDPFREGFLLR
ncbi:MAG: proline racemase family protein [Fimbriimonadales bacterium]|nr:proline racemase family protein [Fimbriimonadales bacterium]